MGGSPFDRFQEISRNFKQPQANLTEPSWLLPVSQRRIPAKADSGERFFEGDKLFTFFQRRHDISEHDEA
jgi:hypothetical protein